MPQLSELKPMSVISDSNCAVAVVKDGLRVEASDDVLDQMLMKLMRTLAHV